MRRRQCFPVPAFFNLFCSCSVLKFWNRASVLFSVLFQRRTGTGTGTEQEQEQEQARLSVPSHFFQNFFQSHQKLKYFLNKQIDILIIKIYHSITIFGSSEDNFNSKN
jgi:hypothetical protein